MPALLLGSLSTLADTSELQREAFNEAFETHGLDWRWERDDYVAMLETNGGQDRVTAYAAARGEAVDAAAIHQTKSALFQQHLAAGAISARPGVVETIAAARDGGFKVGLVTTTSPENVAALTAALAGSVDVAAFDLVVDSSQVEASKPDAAAYLFALERLGENATDCVAVEDNVGGVASATSAGIACVAFPHANTAGHGFEQAAGRVDELDFAELRDLANDLDA
ncbi:MAG: HAD-IA family hydrolase [Nocardioides sp.]|nr:HAD-IA family hydrolase [Nocardioides sp.]